MAKTSRLSVLIEVFRLAKKRMEQMVVTNLCKSVPEDKVRISFKVSTLPLWILYWMT